MKSLRVIIIFFFLSVTLSYSQTYWRKISSPTTKNLNKLCFLDSLTGWIVGDTGTIIKTTDGGLSWITQNSGVTENILDVFMIDTERGWALAHHYYGDSTGTVMLMTTDGGSSWQNSLFPMHNKYFFSIFFLDSLKGWMAGATGTMVGTTDGGSNWFEATIDTASPHLRWNLFRMKFVSSQRGFALGGRFDMTAVLWKTTNGGNTWFNENLGSEPLYDFAFSDSLNGLGVGGDYEYGASVILTRDAGQSWEYRWLGIFGQGRAISFRTSTEAWVPLGFAGAYMYTLDGGETWVPEYLPKTMRQALNDVQFTDRKTGYMVGNAGLIIKYNYFGSTISVSQRWNLVSLPLTVTNPRKDFLFPSASSGSFAFTENGYQLQDTLVNGNGYWIKFPSAYTFELEGFPRTTDTITVRQGWNMIGSISFPVFADSVITEPPSIISSPFFGYQSGYVISDTIQPGKGYWVKVKTAGILILNAPTQ